MITPKPLSPATSVCAQPDTADLPALARAGFRSIISNRLDGEEAGQPQWAEIARAAQAAGLQARHIPVTPGAIGVEDVAQFGRALEELPSPVLAFCRTGMRAASLWALSSVGILASDEIMKRAREAGYDLAPLRERLSSSEGAK